MTTISTRVARPLVVALAAAGIPVAATASSALSATASTTSTTATPYCGITWGSLPKAATPTVTGPLTGVRAGRHACYDRLVLDVAGRAPGYTVRYVDSVYTDGAGTVVPLRGGAKLSLVANAPAYTASGNPSFLPANRAEVVDVTGYDTLRQVAWAGSFEGRTSLGVGVRARLPFRVFTLSDGTTSRVVVDVAHRW